MSIFTTCRHLLYYELLQLTRSQNQLVYPVMLFVLISILFPLAIGSNPVLLKTIAPGVLWVAVMLALMLSLNDLFMRDYDSGIIEQYVLADMPESIYVLIKMLSQWIVTILPLIIGTLVLSTLYSMGRHEQWMLVLSLMLGAPILMCLGTIVAALLVGMRTTGLLLPLLLLPLFVPILIFGSGAVQRGYTPLLLLVGMLVLVITLAPPVAAAALRVGVSGH